MIRNALSFTLLILLWGVGTSPAQVPKRNFPYREFEGAVEEFAFRYDWVSYYWRDDFTLLVRDDAGRLHRVISREPTPWNDLRLGTTYTGLPVDWVGKPRVKIIGVGGIDRIPEKFYDLKLDPAQTTTAFLVRVKQGDAWKDFYVNNWFHDWSPDADRKLLPHFANALPNYTVYGYLNTIAAPFDKAGQAIVRKYEPEWSGIIFHGRVKPAQNEVGYEVELLHLLGRHKKSLDYKVFHGDPTQIPKLDGKGPPRKK